MFDRTIEFWVATVAAVIYVYISAKEKAFKYRLLMVASSAGFGFSLAGDVSNYLGIGETLSGVIIIVFGYIFIDFMSAIFSDREFIKSIIKDRLK